MSVESILFLAMVLGALVEFAAVLTYAEWASKRAAAAGPTLVHSSEVPLRAHTASAANSTLSEKAA